MADDLKRDSPVEDFFDRSARDLLTGMILYVGGGKIKGEAAERLAAVLLQRKSGPDADRDISAAAEAVRPTLVRKRPTKAEQIARRSTT